MAHARQSEPDYGLGVRVEAMKNFFDVPSSQGSGGVTGSAVKHALAQPYRYRGTSLIRNRPPPPITLGIGLR